WREFHGVGQEIERNLAQRTLVSKEARQVALELLDDANILVARLQFHQMAALLNDMNQRHRLLIELVAPGLDARQIEDFVDEMQQMLAGSVNVAGIFAVGRI